MQTAFSQKMVVPTKAAGLAKPSRTSRHVVMAVNGAERNEGSAHLKAVAVAGLAALLIGTEAPAFAAAVPKATGQGELLEQLLEQQKAGAVKAKTIKAAAKPAEVAVYGKNKPISAPKPAAPKPAAKPVAKKPVVEKKVATKALKFDSKAGAGTQGAAPAGLELPVPKGAAKTVQAAKPVAAKKAPAAAKPVAAKAAPAPKAAAKPLAAKKEAPAAPKPAAAAKPVVVKKAAAAAAGAAAATATAAKVATTSAPALKAAASSSAAAAASAGSNDGAIQAGAVLVAELAGLAIAASIVGGITAPAKKAKAAKA